MHPILADVRKLLSYVAAWLLVGVFMAGILVMAGLARWESALVFAIPVCVVFGFIAPSAYYVCRSLPLARRKMLLVVAVFGAASLVSGIAWLGLCEAWNAILRTFGEEWAIALPQPLPVVLFVAGVAFYLLSILAHDVLIGIENIREAEQRDAQSRLLARDAELQVLRMQINPHFLFNSLNSISALTAADAPAARAMTIELAQFFRQTLALSHKQKIPLEDEIALCRSFLAVEKIRFGKRLGTSIEVADGALSALVPPMVLQPLVENAIKHGIRDLVDGGVILVRSFVRERWLHALVENPLDEGARPADGDGVGLRNIRQRLAALYGERARITWTRDAGRFRVEITLPFEHAQSEASPVTALLRALIVDDEDLARCLIREYLGGHPDVEVVGESRNGLEAVADIDALTPDLIFLDIQMPKLSGLEVLEATGRRSGVIFTTAFDEYAIKAFELLAVDYLLKPFSQQRFDEALARARKLVGEEAPALDRLLARPAPKLERLVIRDRGQVHVVPVAEIHFVEAEDDYINIHTEARSFLKTQRLSELEEQLDPCRFVRVHRSWLINIDRLKGLERPTKDSQVAVLANGRQIPVSRTGQERIKACLGEK